MPCLSLVETCRKVANANALRYEHVGNLEYHQIKSVLTQITDAHHLHTIEENSPQIKGEDAELWAKIIARDFPESKTKHHTPENYGEWWEVYVRYKEERVEEIKRDGEEIRQKMMDAQRKKETNVSKVVDLKYLPKIPRDPRMLANNGGVPLKKGYKKESPSTLNFTGGSKTKMFDGKSVLNRARREAKEISNMAKLSRPTHQLKAFGKVTRAPAAMVTQYQNAKKPALLKTAPKVPTAEEIAQKGREARLRAIASGKTVLANTATPSTKVVTPSSNTAICRSKPATPNLKVNTVPSTTSTTNTKKRLVNDIYDAGELNGQAAKRRKSSTSPISLVSRLGFGNASLCNSPKITKEIVPNKPRTNTPIPNKTSYTNKSSTARPNVPTAVQSSTSDPAKSAGLNLSPPTKPKTSGFQQPTPSRSVQTPAPATGPKPILVRKKKPVDIFMRKPIRGGRH